MDYELVYWRHPSIPGIKVEEISGGESYKESLRKEMARQVYGENGRDAYREIGHFRSGAPFLFDEQARISVSHCAGLFVVATLPPTPEVNLEHFSQRAALGVDAERADREQVLKIRERFLSSAELALIPAEDVEANILAWTVKEAVYKAALQPGLDFRADISIEKMPKFAPATPVFDPLEFGLSADTKSIPEDFYGKAKATLTAMPPESAESTPAQSTPAQSTPAQSTPAQSTPAQSTPAQSTPAQSTQEFILYSYKSEDCIVTLAYTPQTATYKKS